MRTDEPTSERTSERPAIERGRETKELQHAVLGIYKRADGIVYVDLAADASGSELKSTLCERVLIETTVYSDTSGGYWGMEAEFAGHETVSHWERE